MIDAVDGDLWIRDVGEWFDGYCFKGVQKEKIALENRPSYRF